MLPAELAPATRGPQVRRCRFVACCYRAHGSSVPMLQLKGTLLSMEGRQRSFHWVRAATMRTIATHPPCKPPSLRLHTCQPTAPLSSLVSHHKGFH